MSFATHEYVAFLILIVGLFQFVPRPLRRVWLLAASYAFYLAWSPIHSLALIGSTFLDYGLAIGIHKSANERVRRLLLLVSILGNLGLLAWFKYSAFAIGTFNDLAGLFGAGGIPWTELILPLGISFYTFQTMSYSIDVYRRQIAPCRNVVDYALYVSFFPQLVAGPIERGGHLIPQLKETELLSGENLSTGWRLILWGLAKKTVVSDRLAPLCFPYLADPTGTDPSHLALASTQMMVVLYTDFSAYTDIARGSARLFGVRLVKNFDRPFLCTSVVDYWSRWHMSLGTWIADYVYSPLSRAKLSHLTVWRNSLLAMTLFGLWHGAAWKFVFWGFMNGVLICAQHSLRLRRARLIREGKAEPREPSLALRLGGWTFCVVMAVFPIVFFFAPSFGAAVAFLSELVPRSLPSASWFDRDVLIGWAVLLALFAVHASGAFIDLPRLWSRITWIGRVLFFAVLGFVILRYQVGVASPFVYFQF